MTVFFDKNLEHHTEKMIALTLDFDFLLSLIGFQNYLLSFLDPLQASEA